MISSFIEQFSVCSSSTSSSWALWWCPTLPAPPSATNACASLGRWRTTKLKSPACSRVRGCWRRSSNRPNTSSYAAGKCSDHKNNFRWWSWHCIARFKANKHSTMLVNLTTRNTVSIQMRLKGYLVIVCIGNSWSSCEWLCLLTANITQSTWYDSPHRAPRHL